MVFCDLAIFWLDFIDIGVKVPLIYNAPDVFIHQRSTIIVGAGLRGFEGRGGSQPVKVSTKAAL